MDEMVFSFSAVGVVDGDPGHFADLWLQLLSLLSSHFEDFVTFRSVSTGVDERPIIATHLFIQTDLCVSDWIRGILIESTP